MPFSLLTSIVFSATLLQNCFGADCWGSTGVDPNDSKQSAWNLRDAVCGHGACAASDSEQGSNHYCVVSQPFADTGMVSIQCHDDTGAFPNWFAPCSVPSHSMRMCVSDSQLVMLLLKISSNNASQTQQPFSMPVQTRMEVGR